MHMLTHLDWYQRHKNRAGRIPGPEIYKIHPRKGRISVA
jgi:hypothetical protein